MQPNTPSSPPGSRPLPRVRARPVAHKPLRQGAIHRGRRRRPVPVPAASRPPSTPPRRRPTRISPRSRSRSRSRSHSFPGFHREALRPACPRLRRRRKRRRFGGFSCSSGAGHAVERDSPELSVPEGVQEEPTADPPRLRGRLALRPALPLHRLEQRLHVLLFFVVLFFLLSPLRLRRCYCLLVVTAEPTAAAAAAVRTTSCDAREL